MEGVCCGVVVCVRCSRSRPPPALCVRVWGRHEDARLFAELRRIARWADLRDISRKPTARAVRELRRLARDIERAAAFEVAGTPWLLILMV